MSGVKMRLVANDTSDGSVLWLLWVYQDHEGDGPEDFFSGRVKLQDEPVALAHAVLDDALEKAQARLDRFAGEIPLF